MDKSPSVNNRERERERERERAGKRVEFDIKMLRFRYK